jgi:hypothetical protein
MLVAKQPPRIPTISSATLDENNNALVSFTPSSYGQSATSYIVQSNPGSFTASGSSSPISLSGTNLEIGTPYTFRVRSVGSYGQSAYSAYTSSTVTPIALSNYESIQTIAVSQASVSTVTFTNIPQTYKHLQIRIFARSTRDYTGNAYDGIDIRANNSYPTKGHQLAGDGTSTGTENINVLYLIPDDGGASADIYAGGIIDILDYSDLNKTKTYRGLMGFDHNGNGSLGFRGVVYLNSGFWNSTSAITSLTLNSAYGGNIKQNSHFALYGIRG